MDGLDARKVKLQKLGKYCIDKDKQILHLSSIL